MRCVVAILALSACLLAEVPTPCPASRPIDDIVTELNKQKSKKNSRNRSLIPETICLWGWCGATGKRPPKIPEPAPPAEKQTSANADSGPVSSSKSAEDKCREAVEQALEAAHNVDVGDYNFQAKNYKAASMRYQDALEQKPDDPAIHVRLGRSFEKLNDPHRALEHYQAAEKLAPPGKWLDEARASSQRLHDN